MANKLTALILAAAIPLSVGASSPKIVGKLKHVWGFVTVANADSVSLAVNGAPLVVGTRIDASTDSSVILSYDNECDVRVSEHESFVVHEDSDCIALIAGVRYLGPTVSPLLPLGIGGIIMTVPTPKRPTPTSGS